MKMIEKITFGIGAIIVLIGIILLILIPFVCNIILVTYFATTIGLTSWVWWAFVINVTIFLMVILGTLTRIGDTTSKY